MHLYILLKRLLIWRKVLEGNGEGGGLESPLGILAMSILNSVLPLPIPGSGILIV